MKRISLIVVFSLCVAVGFALAQTSDVTSVNVVGYSKIDLAPNGRLIFGMNFDNLANGGTNTLLSIFGTNQLTKAINYLNADRVTVWLTSQSKYQSYAMYTDGQFYPCNTLTEWGSSPATNPVIQDGTGMWLVRASGQATTNSITAMGQVVTVNTQQLVLAIGYQLVAYPFSSPMAMSNINVSAMTKAANYLNADRIVTWENNAYQNYGLYTDSKWYKCNTLTEWGQGILATHVIQVGEGVWFIAKTGETWVETNKYLGNLSN